MEEQVAARLQNINLRGFIFGGIAQLGEHLPCKQGVKGSNPFISTMIVFRVIIGLQRISAF